MKIKIEYQDIKGNWNLVCVTSNYDNIEAAMQRYSDDVGIKIDRVRASVAEA